MQKLYLIIQAIFSSKTPCSLCLRKNKAMFRMWKFLYAMFCVCHCMHNKRALPVLDGLPAEKRLRENIVDLYNSNTVSGKRTQGILNDAAASGLGSFRQLVGKVGKHSKRNLTRKLLKNKKWPALYYAHVRVQDKKTNQIVKKKMGFLLPHEIIKIVAEYNHIVYDQSNLSEENKAHVQLAATTWGVSADNIIPLGLWIDGTPCNWDRSDSLESVVLNFPGAAGQENLRIPIASITKRHCATTETFDDILAVVSWSFRVLREGKHPLTRHDGSAFRSGEDAYRQKHQSSNLPYALLCELRGDWKMYKDVLRLPGWQETYNCCCLAYCFYFFIYKVFKGKCFFLSLGNSS